MMTMMHFSGTLHLVRKGDGFGVGDKNKIW